MFVRIKNLKDKKGKYRTYAYLVESSWTKKGPRQKVIKYLGRIELGEFNINNIDFVYCMNCGRKKNLTIDHINSLNNYGNNTLENIQVLCKECNQKKGKKYLDYRKKSFIQTRLDIC